MDNISAPIVAIEGSAEALAARRKELGIVPGPSAADLEIVDDEDEGEEDTDTGAVLAVSLTPKELDYIDEILKGGLFGKTHEECCERLIAAQIEAMLKDQRL